MDNEVLLYCYVCRGAICALERITTPMESSEINPSDVLAAIRSSEDMRSSVTYGTASLSHSTDPTSNLAISSTAAFSEPYSSTIRGTDDQSCQAHHNASYERSTSPSITGNLAGNLAYYHDGWRPANVPVDDSDLRRIGDIERLLCTADATSKSKGCDAMVQLLTDMPVEVLLQRPHSLHAIAAAIKGPINEHMHSDTPNDPPQKGLFDRLLVDIVGVLDVTAQALFLVILTTSY